MYTFNECIILIIIIVMNIIYKELIEPAMEPGQKHLAEAELHPVAEASAAEAAVQEAVDSLLSESLSPSSNSCTTDRNRNSRSLVSRTVVLHLRSLPPSGKMPNDNLSAGDNSIELFA